MIDKKRLIRLIQKLISIDSQNPPGDEAAIAAFVKEYLAKFGLHSKVYEFKKNRANVVARLRGEGKGKSLLITPHLDTVPCGDKWHFKPLAGTIQSGRLYGLGSTDCKVNLACSMEALNSLAEEKCTLGYELVFAATADEESGSRWGLAPLLDKKILDPDEAVVLDADDFEIIITQKGLMHLKVKIEGKRAHGAYPWLGENAINIAVDILEKLKERRIRFSKNRFLRPPTMNIGTIRGGDKVNVVADWCEFELDFRFLPGESDKELLGGLKRIIKEHTSKFSIEIEGIQQPYEIGQDHPLIRYYACALKKHGLPVAIHGSEGATTISFFQEKNIPAIATGFGVEGCAHMSDEYVSIENLCKGALVLESFLKNYKFS
ncbi:MAG TPA: M20 family metallopeptidase [Candidatus Margulisiibacteriota bacterium]|nr:M20 family metallopeptidase [Candidatus Margulisiibacteriota bacterium]